MNYEMAKKADCIAKHLQKKDSRDLPYMVYHKEAYDLLCFGDERKAQEMLKQAGWRDNGFHKRRGKPRRKD